MLDSGQQLAHERLRRARAIAAARFLPTALPGADVVIHMSTSNAATQPQAIPLRERFLHFADREPQLSLAPGRTSHADEASP